MTLNDRLILVKSALIPLCLVFFFTGFFGLAVLVFLLFSFWEQIESFIARRQKLPFKVRKRLDPLADKILVISIFIGLTGIGRAHPLAVIILCARELLIAKFAVKPKQLTSPLGKWSDLSGMIAAVMLMFNLPLAGAVLWLAVILSSLTGGAYLWQNKLIKQLKLS